MSKRLLLIGATTGYQTRAFAAAAERLGYELALATDRCHVLDDPWGDRAIALRFEDPSGAAAVLAAQAEVDGIVAVGDSLTDANISTHDGHHSWPSQLARRLIARRGGRPMAVMNQGLGGNRILHDLRGDSGLRRFDRDVLAQPGVTHAIFMLGANDLRNRNAKPEEEVSAAQMIAGLKQFAVRGQAAGIKVFGGTLTGFENNPASACPAKSTGSSRPNVRTSPKEYKLASKGPTVRTESYA